MESGNNYIYIYKYNKPFPVNRLYIDRECTVLLHCCCCCCCCCCCSGSLHPWLHLSPLTVWFRCDLFSRGGGGGRGVRTTTTTLFFRSPINLPVYNRLFKLQSQVGSSRDWYTIYKIIYRLIYIYIFINKYIYTCIYSTKIKTPIK